MRRFIYISAPSDPPDPPPSAVLVSSYALPSVTDTVSAVNGTKTGAWTEDTDPLLADAGNSIYKPGGDPKITLPASQAAHNLTDISISFYYQRAFADDKHVLLAVGDGSQAGDLSLEVVADGRLRCYHVGSDVSLRFFGSASGISGTNLAVGEAHRITLTLGSAGGHLFLDDTEVGTIPQNVNSWNNARVKYLGIWPDGVLAPAQGAFDFLRIYDGQLDAAEVAALEAATSISLSPPAVAVGELTAFAHSSVNVTTLPDWPPGRTPKEVVSQGAHCSAYVRRAWKPTNNSGTHVDFVTGWQKTTAQEAIHLKLDDDSELDLTYTVAHAIPSPGSGGATRTLDRSDGSPNGTTTFNTWATAVAALATNDVLVVRAPTGTWTDSGGHSIPNYVYDVSTSPAPVAGASGVVVIAHPDDVAAGRRPIIWRNAGRYARFKYAASAAWQVHEDLGSGRVVYESVATSTQPAHSYFGAYRDQVGDWIGLYCYQAITDSTNRAAVMHDTTHTPANGTDVTNFRGPGLLYNKVATRWEVRLTPPEATTYINPGGSPARPYPPWDWTKHYAASTDARLCEIVITDGGTHANRNVLLNLAGRNNWRFYNLDFVYGNVAVEATGQTTQPQFYGCTFLGGTPSDFNNNGLNISSTSSAVLTLSTSATPTTDMLFDRCTMHGAMAPWSSFGEGKGFEGPGGLSMRREHTSWNRARLMFRYCSIRNWWHFTWMGDTALSSPNPVKMHFHHCYMRQAGQDAMLIQQPGNGDYNVNRCFMPSAQMYGFTTVGGAGINRYFTFNVDLRLTALMCGKPGFVKHAETEGGSNTTMPCYVHTPSTGHGGRSDHSDRKYYNTFVGTQNTNGVESFDNFEGCGCGMGPDTRGANNRVFNNIGAVYPGPFLWPGGVSSIVAVYTRESGNNQYDNNVLFRSSGMLTAAAGSNTFCKVNSGSQAGTAYASLAALQAGEGFETNSVQADPQFVVTPAWATSNPFAATGVYALGNYLLGASSPARTGARNLNDQSFPDYDFDTAYTWAGGTNAPWRGALQPDVPALEQEVGICGPQPPEIV